MNEKLQKYLAASRNRDLPENNVFAIQLVASDMQVALVCNLIRLRSSNCFVSYQRSFDRGCNSLDALLHPLPIDEESNQVGGCPCTVCQIGGMALSLMTNDGVNTRTDGTLVNVSGFSSICIQMMACFKHIQVLLMERIFENGIVVNIDPDNRGTMEFVDYIISSMNTVMRGFKASQGDPLYDRALEHMLTQGMPDIETCRLALKEASLLNDAAHYWFSHDDSWTSMFVCEYLKRYTRWALAGNNTNSEQLRSIAEETVKVTLNLIEKFRVDVDNGTQFLPDYSLEQPLRDQYLEGLERIELSRESAEPVAAD